MKNLTLLIANTLTLSGTLLINYAAGTGSYAGKSVGEVSDQYPTLLTPASYAFSIWGLIYLLLTAFVVYQWVAWRKGRSEESLQKAGPWFTLTNIANAGWISVWVNEALGLSVLIMFCLLACLVVLVKRLELEVWDAPLRIIVFVWWPVCIYLGWITVASITNVTVYLSSQGWLENVLSGEIWAVVMIIIACFIYLWLTYTRNLREAAMVGVWGLTAIAVNQWDASVPVGVAALIAAAILLIYAGYHGYRNRATSPVMKLKGGG